MSLPYSPPPRAPGSRVEGAGGAFDADPCEATIKYEAPSGFPAAFAVKSGAPRRSREIREDGPNKAQGRPHVAALLAAGHLP